MNDGLIFIDLQNDYFRGGNMKLINTQTAGANARRPLLDNLRTNSQPIMHGQHISLRPDATTQAASDFGFCCVVIEDA